MIMRFKITLIFLYFSLVISAQTREHAYEVNNRLGRGINFGNMFEAPSEQAWGNAWKPEYAGMIAEKGFNHIRIPIRWEPSDRSSAISPYTISSTFLNRIKQVVDSALNNHLHVIINMHHHDALLADPEGQKPRFLAQWKQISAFFKNYSDSLLFEILNEPNGNITPAKWNVFLADALATIRQDNPTRIVVIGTPEWGGLGGLSYMQLPDDENIILTVHYYNPFQFTHQGASWVGNGTEANAWLGTKWNDSETERAVVQQEFAPLVAFEKAQNIPIHIGEFGAYEKADLTSRKKWTTYISRYMETLNWSWAYWEFSAGFGIYNPNTKVFNTQLVDALLHNQMPEPAKYVGTPVYKSNFNTSTDGWVLYKQGTAVCNLSQANSALNITISNGSTENWHVQLVKNNIKLQAGKKYRYSFKVKAGNTRAITSYIGMTVVPWSAYSGYNSVTASDTFSVFTYVFDQNKTDNTARIAFDLGKSNTDIVLSDFLLEEIVLEWPTQAEIISKYRTTVYPNPASDKIFIDNQDDFKEYSILKIQGNTIETSSLNRNQNQIDLSNYPSGIYFISITGINKRLVTKIVRK